MLQLFELILSSLSPEQRNWFIWASLILIFILLLFIVIIIYKFLEYPHRLLDIYSKLLKEMQEWNKQFKLPMRFTYSWLSSSFSFSYFRGHLISKSFVRISLVSVLLTTFYGFCLIVGSVDFFWEVFFRVGLSLGGRTFSFALCKLGCSAGLSVAIIFLIKGVLTLEVKPLMMVPAGSEEEVSGASSSGPSTSFPKLDWEKALDLPDDERAPECLQSHLRQELRYLFNIGRRNTLSDNIFESFIEPLSIDRASVGFSRALLARVRSLKIEHYNNRNHILFEFRTKGERERFYSIMWEYVPKQ